MAKGKRTGGRKTDFRNKTQQRYYDATQKVRRKVSRVKSTYGIDLSDTVPLLSKQDILNTDFRVLRKQMKELEWFTDKSNLDTRFTTNKKGVTISQAKRRRIDEANALMKEREREWEEKYGSQKFSARPGEEGIATMSELASMILAKNQHTNPYRREPIVFDEVENERNLDRKMNSWFNAMDGETMRLRMLQYKINYVAMLHKRYNGIPPELEEKIYAVPDEDFLELTKKFNDVRFDVASTPMTMDEVDNRLEALEQILDGFLRDDPDMDTSLKIF